MPKKSVTFRFFDSDDKYGRLIHELSNYEALECFSGESLRSIDHDVFLSWPSSQEITQLKDFIKSHKKKIVEHIE